MHPSPSPTPPALGRPLALAIGAAFVALVAGVGLLDAAHWLLRGPAPGGAQRDVSLDTPALLHGGASAALEHNLQSGSYFASTMRPRWNELRVALLGDGGRNVVVGRDDWLFLASDLRPPADTRRLQREYAAHVEAGALALRSLGARTLFVVVPDKAGLARAKLPPGFDVPAPTYADLLHELHARGVDAPDVLGWMRSGSDAAWYRRDDTHWTLGGVERVAALLACAVRARVGTNADVPPVLEAKLASWPPFKGIRPDLLNGLGIDPSGEMWRRFLDPEFGRVIGVQRGSAAPRIALAGTSMSFKQLRESLCAELGVDVANYAQAGAGTSGKLVDALLDFASGRAPAPELLVWETVERYGREGPCLTFAGLPAALESVYAARWSTWSELAAGAARRRNLLTLARVPIEGEPLPRRSDAWDVRRFEHAPAAPEVALVLPGNGTFAVAFDAPTAGVALVGAHFAERAWTDAIVRPLDAGARRLPLLGADWFTAVEVALRSTDGADAPAPSAWRIDSAWARAGACAVRTIGTATLIELAPANGAAPAFDGTLALELVLEAPAAGTARLRAGEGLALEFPLRAGRSRCVVPLRGGDARETPRAARIALELPDGARIDGAVERLELRVPVATMPR